MSKKDHITMRIDEDAHTYLKRMAKRENRTLSNMIYTLLAKAIRHDKAVYKVKG